MIGTARRFLREENGASAAEYVLLLAIIGGGAAIAAVAMGDSIGGSLSLSSLIIADTGASDGSADPGLTGASSPDPRQSPGGQGAGQDGDGRTALADCAHHLQSPAVRVGDALGDRQPQPAAALRAIAPAIGAEEAIEYSWQVFRRDAGASVVDADDDRWLSRRVAEWVIARADRCTSPGCPVLCMLTVPDGSRDIDISDLSPLVGNGDGE